MKKNFDIVKYDCKCLTNEDITTLNSLCKSFNISLILHDSQYPDPYMCQTSLINASYAGGSTIWLGYYVDREKKLASFFHELAHCLDANDNHKNKFTQECYAWEFGFELARNYGYNFNSNTVAWCFERLNSYLKSKDYEFLYSKIEDRNNEKED